MKKLILFLLASINLVALAQTTPTVKTRSDDTFQQVDNYLIALKRLGIPYGSTNTLTATGTGANSIKLFYNTTTNKLMVYNPATASWSIANDISLDDYYTKTQSDGRYPISNIIIPASGDGLRYNGSIWINSPIIATGPLSWNGSTWTMSIATASTSTTGALSNIDWNTFNNKQSALLGTGFVKSTAGTISYDNTTYNSGSGTANYVTKYTGTNTQGSSPIYSSTNTTIVIGSTNPSAVLDKSLAIINDYATSSLPNRKGIAEIKLSSFNGGHADRFSNIQISTNKGSEASSTYVSPGDLVGSIYFGQNAPGTDSLYSSSIIQSYATETWITGAARGSKLVFGTARNGFWNGDDVMVIDQNLNVGIGYGNNAVSDYYKLDVNGSGRYKKALITDEWTSPSFTGHTGNRMEMYYSTAGGGGQISAYDRTNNVAKPLAITASSLTLASTSVTAPFLTALKPVFTDVNKNFTSTGPGTSSQFLMGDGSLNSNTYLAPSATTFIGTTSHALNRASGTENLTGIGSLAMGGALSGATTINASSNITAAGTLQGNGLTITGATNPVLQINSGVSGYSRFIFSENNIAKYLFGYNHSGSDSKFGFFDYGSNTWPLYWNGTVDGNTTLFASNARPDANNTYDLGGSSYRWKDFYSGTGDFSGTVKSAVSLLVNSASTSAARGYTFQSPSSNWGPQPSGVYFTPKDGTNAAADFSIKLWDGNGNSNTVFAIDGVTRNVTFSGVVVGTYGGLKLKSPNGNTWDILVSDAGVITASLP